MSRTFLQAIGAIVAFLAAAPAAPGQAPIAGTQTPDERSSDRLHRLAREIDAEIARSALAEAAALARDQFRLQRETRGEAAPATVLSRRVVETLERMAARPPADQERFAAAFRDMGLDEQLYQKGNYAAAERQAKKLLTAWADLLGEDNIYTARSLNNLGEIARALQAYAEAEGRHRRALAIRQKVLGATHPQTAVSHANLGLTLGNQSKWSDAEAELRRALDITTAASPDEAFLLAMILSHLAEVRLALGRQAEAEEAMRRSLEVFEKWRGPEHPEIAPRLTLLSKILNARGKHAEAEAVFVRALNIENRSREGGRHVFRRTLNDAAEVTRIDLLKQGLALWVKILGERNARVANMYHALGMALADHCDYAEAEATHRRALAIREDVLGKTDPAVALSCNNLALVLADRGQMAEAETLLLRALDIWKKAGGEKHETTAAGYHNLGTLFEKRGAYEEAESMLRRALSIREAVLGPTHPDTGLTCDNLGLHLHHRGQFAESEKLLRRALAIWQAATPRALSDAAAPTPPGDLLLDPAAQVQGRIFAKIIGRDQGAQLASTTTNLAVTLEDRGLYAEAEALNWRALAIATMAVGADHPLTARIENNLSCNLYQSGRTAEAEERLRRALATMQKTVGELDAMTAAGYNNLAWFLSGQDKTAEAESMHRRARAIREKVLGPDHPQTALSRVNLATNLHDRHEHAAAEAELHRALGTMEKSGMADGWQAMEARVTLSLAIAAQSRMRSRHGEAEAELRRVLRVAVMPRVLAEAAGVLAGLLEEQGRDEEALALWAQAVEHHEQVRGRQARGFSAPRVLEGAPSFALATALARVGRPREAWERWEAGLARGLLDEVSGRAARPLTADELRRDAELLEQARALDDALDAAAAAGRDQPRLDDVRRRADAARRALLDHERSLEARYGAPVGRPSTLDDVRRSLGEADVLVGWVDAGRQHWACLLRRAGEPLWIRLPGSGAEGAWTDHDAHLASHAREQLQRRAGDDVVRPLAEALARQRLAPLMPHLAEVKRLVIAHSPGLDGVPVEVLLAANPGGAGRALVVSYTPSASMFAYLAARGLRADRTPSLLAVADPTYTRVPDDAPVPPERGLTLLDVTPNGNAGLNGLRPGDVLLSYAGIDLTKPDDLKPAAPAADPTRVRVIYWRAGRRSDLDVAPGPLGVTIDPGPPRVGVVALRDALRVGDAASSATYESLPGTHREVEAIAALFPAGRVARFEGDRARESTLQELARSDRLKTYRFLHLATHGRADRRDGYRSALILAPDPADDDPTAQGTDGAITAEQIARTWRLDADLVVLSACGSGLGRAVDGEGYLGFAQPLFAKGARSLVLALWDVDDDATALLMWRFYRNLLGSDGGGLPPRPKAESLAEAKAWLRGLRRDEVDRALTEVSRGVVVRRRPGKDLRPVAADHPFADVKYWAGFVLIGGPDD